MHNQETLEKLQSFGKDSMAQITNPPPEGVDANKGTVIAADVTNEPENMYINRAVEPPTRNESLEGQVNLGYEEAASKGTDGRGASILGGKDNLASANYAIACGIDCTASHTAALALGSENTASGQYSVAIGKSCLASTWGALAAGNNTTASGNAATSLGQRTEATGAQSLALGDQSKAILENQIAWASKNFAAVGDAQASMIILKTATTDENATELFSGTSGRITLAEERAFSYQIQVTARQDDGSNHAYYVAEGIAYRNTSGNITLIGNTVTAKHESNSDWDFTVAADTTNQSLKLSAVGVAATNIRWVASVRLTEVAY